VEKSVGVQLPSLAPPAKSMASVIGLSFSWEIVARQEMPWKPFTEAQKLPERYKRKGANISGNGLMDARKVFFTHVQRILNGLV